MKITRHTLRHLFIISQLFNGLKWLRFAFKPSLLKFNAEFDLQNCKRVAWVALLVRHAVVSFLEFKAWNRWNKVVTLTRVFQLPLQLLLEFWIWKHSQGPLVHLPDLMPLKSLFVATVIVNFEYIVYNVLYLVPNVRYSFNNFQCVINV